MALLNGKFNTPRGYPNGSALAEPFAIKKTGSPLAPVSLPQGSVITQELQSGGTVVDKATTPDLSSADPIDAWVVVEGNDDYSGAYTGKCMACKLGTGLLWETDNYAAGSYPAGTPVSFNAGTLKVKAANEQIVGYVLHDNSSSTGTLVISS